VDQGKLLIIIPALNEELSIGPLVQEIRSLLPEVRIVVVDDASRDQTAAVARMAGAEVLELPHHLGLGGGVQAGYRLAYELGYDYVVRLDGDGQHDPRDIPAIYRKLVDSGCQMVIGSRFVNGPVRHPHFLRATVIRFFRVVLRPILGQPVYDPTSGFVGVNRQALQVFSKSFPLDYPEIETLVVLQRKAFRFAEVPCRMRPRTAGRSTITPWRSIFYIVHVLLGVFVNVLKYDGRQRRK
jgi:glycosyltransferase involved in cell wall biosynthesis